MIVIRTTVKISSARSASAPRAVRPPRRCARDYERSAKTVSSSMTEGEAGRLRVSGPRSNEFISARGYGAGTLIIGAVAPVIMAVLAVPVWIMFFNV
jgi:hypothetical protein